MGIKEINVSSTGQVGINPRRVTIITTDNLATVTAANYLNSRNLQGFTIYSTDEIVMRYGYVSSASPGTFAIFTASVTAAGTVTLTEWANPGEVLLPVVSNNFSNFNGTGGQIKDSGYSPTNAAKTKVVMLNAAPAAATNMVQYSAIDGTIGDAGFQMKSVAGASAAGGAAAQSFTDAFSTTGSNIVGNWNTQANAASVLKIVPGNGSFVVTSSADAGVGTFNYIITK